MREFILTQRRRGAENAETISGCLQHGVWVSPERSERRRRLNAGCSAPASITSAHSAPLRLCVKTLSAALITFLSVTANALPLVWRADWPGSKPVETLVHRGTDIEFQPQWYINGEPANSTNWTFQTFVQTNAQATGEWFGPLPGAAFSHANDIGAAFYNVMIRAQMPGGGVNYTAFARLRMLDSPGYTPGELPLPVSTIDFAQVVAVNAPWLLPSATNALWQTVSLNSAAIATNATAIAGVKSNLANNYYTASETDDAIDALAAYYITANANGAAFATYAALTNATVFYSGGVVRVPTRNDYCVVLADESHGGAEWRYIYAVPDGATAGQWEAQYPIEANDYQALSNKPQINGNTLTGEGSQSGASLGLLDLLGGTMQGDLGVDGHDIDITNAGRVIVRGTDGHAAIFANDGIDISTDDGMTWTHFDWPSAAGTLALTSDITAAISPTDSTFSNAVLSVGLGIDTNTVAVINELVDSAHDLPVTGATSVGALLLALAAAVATLKKNKADASALRYAISESIPLTVTSDAASTTLDDRMHNVRTVAAAGSGNTTTITATLPPIVAGKSRDMFLNLTVGTQASDAGDISLSIVEPSGATVQIDIGSVEDIGIGKNEILISESALPTTSGNATTTHWLVTVRHEDFT